LDTGRGSIPGGAVALIFHSELDSESARSLDLAGAGADGDLIGAAGDCCMAAGPMRFGATRFMTVTPSRTGIIADSQRPALAATRPRAVTPRRRIGEIAEAQVPAPLAESRTVGMREVNLRAAGPAWVGGRTVAEAEAMPVAAGTDADTN
jgi:hypothetical protein